MSNNKNVVLQADKIIDGEIELLEYVVSLLNYKYRIILIALTASALMFIASKFMDKRYDAFIKIALVEATELGGVTPDNRRAPEAVTLVEQNFISNAVNENQQDRVIARMVSRIFTKKFIVDNNLLPVIFYKQWDAANKVWKNDFKPDLFVASNIFKHKICSVNRNDKNNLMRVKISLHDPKVAAYIANKFVDDFNHYQRMEDIEEADRKILFLKETLHKTEFLELQKSLNRLIEAQFVIKMLAVNKKEYTLEVLDPATVPLYKSAPASKNLAIMTFVGVMMLCVVLIIGKIVLDRVNSTIKDYRRSMQ